MKNTQPEENNTDNFPPTSPLIISFDENWRLPLLLGEYDAHLKLFEEHFNIQATGRGNRVFLTGPKNACEETEKILRRLYDKIGKGHAVEPVDIKTRLKFAAHKEVHPMQTANNTDPIAKDQTAIATGTKTVTPRSPGQEKYIRMLQNKELIFAIGPAGTGKTYIAVARAAAALNSGEVERIILSRPAVEAGEQLGFLPGDMKEKIDPYLRPLYDALYELLPINRIERGFSQGMIEIAPLAFMRGRTLSNAFIILDEAQNTTTLQMKMFLTRMGENSHMVVTGDPSQVDLPAKEQSGLYEAISLLHDIEGVSVMPFNREDIMRHPLVNRILEKYEEKRNANN